MNTSLNLGDRRRSILAEVVPPYLLLNTYSTGYLYVNKKEGSRRRKRGRKRKVKKKGYIQELEARMAKDHTASRCTSSSGN
jgi:hypothetical protein